jgi:hypothetical protein
MMIRSCGRSRDYAARPAGLSGEFLSGYLESACGGRGAVFGSRIVTDQHGNDPRQQHTPGDGQNATSDAIARSTNRRRQRKRERHRTMTVNEIAQPV